MKNNPSSIKLFCLRLRQACGRGGLIKYSATCVISFHFALCHWPSSRTFTSSGQAHATRHGAGAWVMWGKAGKYRVKPGPGDTCADILVTWTQSDLNVITDTSTGSSECRRLRLRWARLGWGHWLLQIVPGLSLQIFANTAQPRQRPGTWRTCVSGASPT